MDVMVATKLIQDKVKQIVKQQKAAAEASAESASTAGSITSLPRTATSQPSQPSQPTTSQSNIPPTQSVQPQGQPVQPQQQSQPTVSHQSHSQVTIAPAGLQTSPFNASVSSPVLQNLAADGHQPQSTDSGICADQRRSETNGSNVSSHPSEMAGSQSGSQQVASNTTTTITQLPAATSSEPSTNHTASAVSGPNQPQQMQSNLATSMPAVVGSQIPSHASGNAAAQSLPSDQLQLSSTSSASINPAADLRHDQSTVNSQSALSRASAGTTQHISDLSGNAMTATSEGSSSYSSTTSSITQPQSLEVCHAYPLMPSLSC